MLNNILIQARKPANERESGVAMIMAVLITLVMVTLVVSMTAMALRGLEKGKATQDLTAASMAADSAISHAVALSNSIKEQNGQGISRHIGKSNAVYGNYTANEINPETGDGQYSWRWYAEKVALGYNDFAYDIHATGYQNDPDDATARNFVVRLEATTVEDALYDTAGNVYYAATSAGMFGWNAFANTSVEMETGAALRNYDSRSSLGFPSAYTDSEGVVGTNNTIIMPSGITAAAAMFMNTPVGAIVDSVRCQGAWCDGNMNLRKSSYGMSLASAKDLVDQNCPNSTYPDWVASANGGHISYDTAKKCYNNIIFDQDTSIPVAWSSGNPAVMYAKGNITVKPGIEVARQASTSQGPLALRIYSKGTADFTMERGTVANPTRMNAVIAGPNLKCNIGGDLASTTAHGTKLFGSVSCNTVKIESGSEIWRDAQIEKVMKEGSPTSKKIWNIQSYQEI